MGLTDGLRGIWKPIAAGLLVFSLFSSIFVVSYVFITYQAYLKSYEVIQSREIKTLTQKTEAAIEDLKKLLRLAEVRIHETQGNPQRLQGILSSLHHLQAHQALPEFQKVSYTTLSIPYMTVTRFGVLPLDHTNDAIRGKSLVANKEPAVTFGEKTLEGQMFILHLPDIVEGVLEIEIDLTTFKRFLGTYETIGFNPLLYPENAKRISNVLLVLYGKMPDQFWAYAFANKAHYAIFSLYAILTVLLIGFYLYYLNKRLQKNYQSRFANLEDICSKASHTEKTLREELGASQLDGQVHQIACQVNKKIHFHRKERQNEYASHALLILNTLQKSLKNPLAQLKITDQIEILNTCLQKTRAFSGELWQPIRNEVVNFKEILDNLQLLFAEKIHKGAIRIEVDIAPQHTPFMGDPLVMEALLINAIGKPLHRVPNNGIVSVELKEELGFLSLEIQDNGFVGAEVAERLIGKSFELFMTEEAFHQACLSNGLEYKMSKTKNNLNVTQLIMPTLKEEALNSNVVKLFS